MGKGTSVELDVIFIDIVEVKEYNGKFTAKAAFRDVEQGEHDLTFVAELYDEKFNQFATNVAKTARVRIHCNIRGSNPYYAPGSDINTAKPKFFTSLRIWKWEAIPSTATAPQVPQNAYVAPQPTQTAPAQQTYQAPVQATTPPSILPSALPAAPPYHSAAINHGGHILCQNTMSGAWLYWNGSQWLPVPPQQAQTQTQTQTQAPAPAFNPAPAVAPGDQIVDADVPF